MGMRWANGSTIAFLAAQPKTFVSWDLDPHSVVSQTVKDLIRLAGPNTRFQPRCGDTTEIIIEPTDLLFIDTWHTAKQLQTELHRHVPAKVRKFVIMHDTFTFGLRGEDGKEPGLRAAIRDFQMNWMGVWRLMEDKTENNGLVVLAREGRWADFEKPLYERNVIGFPFWK